MSVESIAIALHHSKARGAARLVLIGIANHDGDGGAWPSISTLSIYAGGIDPRSVKRILRQLEALGEIKTILTKGGGDECPDYRRPNLYRFLLTCPPDCTGAPKHTVKKGVTQESPGDLAVIREVTEGSFEGVTQESPKPSIEPSTNQPAAKGGGNVPARETRERSGFVVEFGFEWQPAWERYLPESRALGILKREGVRDSDEARRILAEWASCGARGFDRGAANALVWACRKRAQLAHTAAGDERMAPWA